MGRGVRLLSANVWNGRADPQALAALLRERDVDVAALQELGPEQAEAVADVLPHGVLEPARNHRGMGIAARRPVGHDRLPLPCRDARIGRLDPADWPGLARPLEIIATHIMGIHVWPQWEALPMRRGQLHGLLRYLDEAPEGARILVGDFNAMPGWPVHRRLAKRLPDVAVRVARREGRRPARTWGPSARWPRLLRIDHALAEGVHVESFEVIPIPDGDHSGLLIDLST